MAATAEAKKVEAVIATKVLEVANDPGTPLSRKDVKPVTDALNERLGPWILDLTNNEPWYQSKIIWGLIISAVSTIARPVAGELVTTEQAAMWADSLSTLGQLVGIGYAGYIRLRTRKAISGK